MRKPCCQFGWAVIITEYNAVILCFVDGQKYRVHARGCIWPIDALRNCFIMGDTT